jgi:hypothetical protein
MKSSSFKKVCAVLGFSAFMAGAAVAGPAYPSMFIIKHKPVAKAQPAKCAMMKETNRIVTAAPRPNVSTVKVASAKCTPEMMRSCVQGDHTRC